MDRPALLAAATLLGVSLAGCLGTPQASDSTGISRLADLLPIGAPILQDHDHAEPGNHTGHANIEAVGYSSGYGDGSPAALDGGQGFSELFVWEGERDGAPQTLVLLGRRGGPEGGFVILDATDVANITPLGQYPGLANYDIEATEDGQYAFFTTQFLPTNQDPATIDVVHDQRGAYVVDISDPANPQMVWYMPVPTRGAHTLTYHKLGGRELVVLNTYDFIPDPSLGLPVPGLGGNPVAHRTLIMEFVRTPLPHLELLSIFQKTQELAPQGEAYFPHDTYIQEHPLTGQVILYVSYWDLGAFLVDITDPTNPQELSQLTDFTPSKHAAIHFTRPAPELIDGIHLTVTEPELGPTDETGQLTFYDTTDPTNPKRLGYWTLPGDLVIDQGLIFSPHNFDIANGRIYLAHYHAGVWVIDVSTRAMLEEPQSLGYYQTGVEGRDDGGGYSPNYWSAFYRDGLVYASDIASGLQVLRFAWDAPPGDPRAEGRPASSPP